MGPVPPAHHGRKSDAAKQSGACMQFFETLWLRALPVHWYADPLEMALWHASPSRMARSVTFATSNRCMVASIGSS
jgi:hypothetical protein